MEDEFELSQTPFAFLSSCRCCAPLHLLNEDNITPSIDYFSNDEIIQSEDWSKIKVVFDSHSHIHINRTTKSIPSGYIAVVQSIEEKDWQKAVEFCEQNPRQFRAAFGIHPWYAHEIISDQLEIKLRTILEAHPLAAVGEIGLCKCAKNVRGPMRESGFTTQLNLMKNQLRIAATFSRSVSIHCVKAHASLLQALEEIKAEQIDEKGANQKIPAIALHSFSGSAHHVKLFLNHFENSPTRIYFGFSHTINVQLNSKPQILEATILAVPDNLLLVESDLDDIALAPNATKKAIAHIARIKGWSLEHTAQLTANNARGWLNDPCVHNSEDGSRIVLDPQQKGNT